MQHSATLLYCETSSDGTLRPLIGERVETEFDSQFQPGLRIGERYQLRSVLGRGGMGRVFLARDERLDRLVAIKVVARRTRASDQDSEALSKEARLGALLNHAGIATVFDFGVHAGRYYTVFEYVEGLTLRDVMNRRRQLSLDEASQIITSLARALDYAHSNGIVHRDLKPENVCVAKNGQLKILDLGTARDLRHDYETASFSGTPAYAAPEQAACGPTDGRTDQYALGIMAYEMLAGARPFVSDNPTALLIMHQDKRPLPIQACVPDVPREAADAIMRAIEKDPRDRFGTCQEFASALTSHSAVNSMSHSAVDMHSGQRHDVYLCYTSNESLTAKSIAQSLEQRGFSVWYYQRDAIPGVSTAAQTIDAIRRSAILLLLISREALISSDFASEVREAYQCESLFLPVLVDVSTEEFESHQPQWRAMLGTAAVTELDRHQPEKTMARLVNGLNHLAVRPTRESIPAESSPVNVFAGQIWATDANQIDIGDLDKIVFTNPIIDDFLKRKNKCFLSGMKGLGKTLLLTYKRSLLSKARRESEADQSLCMVPQGRPFLDFMSEMKSLSKKYEKPLSELNTSKRVWSAALRISAISNHPTVIDPEEAFEIEAFPKRIQRWMLGSRIQPTVVFKELTSLPLSDINRLIDGTENFLDQKVRSIHGATFFFIDKVDQAVRQLSRSAWINIQAGLIEAAWDLMNANSHIKVFATIRQEAFANYESDIKSNLYGATTTLRYTDQEMLQLLDNLSRCYEGSDGFRDFIGFNVVKHYRRPLPEDSFQYVRRHTLGRPRDFVAIASELSANKGSLNERRFCDLVRQVSATGLVANVFDEMQVFLDCLADKATRLRFLAELPANVLSRDEAVAVNARFNGLPIGVVRQFGEESDEIYHPFRDLYMMGLLGVIVRDEDSDEAIQKFKQPDDIVSDINPDLPSSPFYLIHPALSRFVDQQRSANDYYVFRHIVVGENAEWHPYDSIILNLERHTANIQRHELRDAVHQVVKLAQGVLSSGTPKNLRMVLDSMSEWQTIQRQLLDQQHDEIILWMDELVSFSLV